MFDSLLNSKFYNKWYEHGSLTFCRFSSGSRELQPFKLALLVARASPKPSAREFFRRMIRSAFRIRRALVFRCIRSISGLRRPWFSSCPEFFTFLPDFFTAFTSVFKGLFVGLAYFSPLLRLLPLTCVRPALLAL